MEADTTVTSVEELLRTLKEALGMKRIPKNSDLPLYFFYCYKLAHPNPAKGGTLRASFKPLRVSKTTPSTRVIKEVLGLHTKDYDKYFRAFCEFSFSGGWNWKSGRMRDLKAWTPLAHSVFGPCSFDIPDAFLRRMKTGAGQKIVESPHPILLGDILHPQQWYFNSEKSPHRMYHLLQNLSKDDKRRLFAGCVDVDIASCFASIWWNELGGRDCELDNAWLLNPEHREELYRVLLSDPVLGLKDKEEAKEVRSKLFSDNSTFKVQWLKDLHTAILERVREEDTTCHELFTRHERRIIERLSQCGQVALWMHDGIIFRSCDEKALIQAAGPHILEIEKW